MYLEESEAQRFYRIWLGLLEFTNQKHQVDVELKELRDASMLDPQQLLPIKNKLWEDEDILDEYLKHYENTLEVREVEIIKSWKRRVSGKFIIMRHLVKYSVFMHGEKNGKLYGVTGISNPIEDMFPTSMLPLYVDVVLVPFEGKIIYDSLMLPYSISFGSGMKRSFNEDYRNLKKTFGIITVL